MLTQTIKLIFALQHQYKSSPPLFNLLRFSRFRPHLLMQHLWTWVDHMYCTHNNRSGQLVNNQTLLHYQWSTLLTIKFFFRSQSQPRVGPCHLPLTLMSYWFALVEHLPAEISKRLPSQCFVIRSWKSSWSIKSSAWYIRWMFIVVQLITAWSIPMCPSYWAWHV